MSKEELRTEIYHLIFKTENDSVLEEVLLFLEKSSLNELEIIPGLPSTDEEKLASVERGVEEYRNGLSYTTEELFKMHPEWKFDGQKQPVNL